MENALELMERNYALRLLIAIYDNPGASKMQIIRNMEGNERTKYLRILDLEAAGLVKIDKEKREHNAMKLYTTALGQEVAKQFKDGLEIIEVAMSHRDTEQ